MKNLINELIDTYNNYDEFKRQLENYHRFVNSEDGKFVYDIFQTLKLTLTLELLSARFTKLPATEKDVQQRTIYQIDQILDFLMRPMGVINEKKSRTMTYAPKSMVAATKPTRKGNKNGRN